MFDVVLPVKGGGQWLSSALISLSEQILMPDNVIVVDDGIDDLAAVQVLGTKLFGTRCRFIPNSGRGISSALNTGVGASRAKWIARMDADDLSYPERFAQQMDYLRAHPRLIACGCQVRQVDRDGRSLGDSHYPAESDAVDDCLLERSCFAHPSLVIRRDCLKKVPYRRVFDGAEDVDLLLRLSEHGSLANLDFVLLDYRIGVHQVNYRQRARQTALQELAFRAARIRRASGKDPLDEDCTLATRFVTWRLSQKGYADSRQAMTAARYLAMTMKVGDMRQSLFLLRDLLGVRPWRLSVIRWIYQVLRAGPGSIALQPIDNAGLKVLNT